MPIQLQIYAPDRIVVAVGRGQVTVTEIGDAIEEIVVTHVIHYRKLVDVSAVEFSETHQQELLAADPRLRALADKRPRGPLAIVADPRHDEHVRVFKVLTTDDRPVEVFRSIHDARKWLEDQPYED